MIIDRDKLRRMITERKMKIVDLARQSGLSYEGAWVIVNKEGHNVSNNSIQKIAWGLGLTFSEIKELLEIKIGDAKEKTTEELELKCKKIQELERELKRVKRKLEPKDKKIGIFLRKTDLEDLRELAQKNNMIVNLFIEKVLEKALDNNVGGIR